LAPVPVAGTRRFRQVTAGFYHTCAITTDDRAFCWGRNAHGQLGLGTFRDRSVPTAVVGGLQFRQVSAGDRHTCGATLADRAYCWGRGDNGRLGDGTIGEDFERPAPAAVVGGLRFSRVSAGFDHSCGVTTANRAYCWGVNTFGQLGTLEFLSSGSSASPVAVAGGRSFNRISAGREFSCAVTTGNRAFCWGNGRVGQVGDGKNFLRFTPRAVTGGLLFRGVSAGGAHACAVTTDNRAYCWGLNVNGQLGNGTDSFRQLSPGPVVGGLEFRQVEAGGAHTCGVTTGDRAYCWGWNGEGRLGDGTTTQRSTPVPVGG
jgi:alpha-tubulin suppressor-like RCC1 family protein